MGKIIKIKIASLILILLISLNLPKNKLKNTCDRDKSRIVRKFIVERIRPIFKKFQKDIPIECPFNKFRDVYAYQESAKSHKHISLWKCSFCRKFFSTEYLLDLHFDQEHDDKLNLGESAICLANYCSILRCDYLYIKSLILKFDEYEHGTSIQIWNPKMNNKHPYHINFDCSILDNYFCENSTNITKDELLNRFAQFKEAHELKCDKKSMRDLRKQCEYLIDISLIEIAFVLSENQLKKLKNLLNNEICYFLTCDRYWNDEDSVKNITWKVQIYFIGFPIFGLCIAFVTICIYNYYREKKKYTENDRNNFIRDESNNDIPADDEFIYVSYSPQLNQQFLHGRTTYI